MSTHLLLNRMIDAEIPCGGIILEGDLRIPETAHHGLIVFSHGSGSSRLGPRNLFVAQKMRDRGFATLLFDALTEEEAEARASSGTRRCDLVQLTQRLMCAIEWARRQRVVSHLPIGVLGSSTGAAAALTAASLMPGISAVVSRGGRPELAGERLHQVTAPTLLIAGSQDIPILQRNRESLKKLRGVGKMAIIPGASHLFEERGTLDEASRMAANWFATHLGERGILP